MSKSKEALNQQKNSSATQSESDITNRINAGIDPSTGLGGQANFGSSRETRSDFPRRSMSNRERRETYLAQSQNPNNPRYNRQAEHRGGYIENDQSAANRQSDYDNRQWSGEDSGDFYSRSIRERTQTDEYRDRNQPQSGYRSYEQGSQGRQGANPSGYRTNQQRRDYENRTPEGYRSRSSRPATSRRDEGFHDNRVEGYHDNRFEGAQGYNRRDEVESYRPARQQFETSSPAPWQNPESNFGVEPWFDRGGEGYGYQVRCRDLMTRDVTVCTPETSIREVAEMMESENVGSIPVVENGRLVGLVTDRDIVCRILAEGGDTRSTTVRDAMTDDIITCLPEEPIIDAIHKMGDCQVRRIPICDPTGKLRGILSMGDVALEAERDMEVARALEQISEPSQSASRRRW